MRSPTSLHIQRVYVSLTLLNTLAASMIWGVNTIFLLDAGLTNAQAFGANAFFTLGQVIFEVPTGIVADSFGRRTSYLLGTLTLSLSTLLYLAAWYARAPFMIWAGASMLLGLGFTFFSGATEAWLVDALKFSGFKGKLESVFAKGQIVGGIAMLVGSVTGGFIAQLTHLGVPYIVRAAFLGVNFLIAVLFMQDVGFTPKRSKQFLKDVRHLFRASIRHGIGNPAVRWIMLAAPFTTGVGFYVFYAMQPYLLSLYGDNAAYGIAGLAAAIVAGSQIIGGLTVPYISRVFTRRTHVLATTIVITIVILMALSFVQSFWLALVLLVVWGLTTAAASPVRQAYMNGLIPTSERATVLSFDSLIGSTGGIFIQPILGRIADSAGYAMSLRGGAAFEFFALPFAWLAHRAHPPSDEIK